jgi:hypothetical protein
VKTRGLGDSPRGLPTDAARALFPSFITHTSVLPELVTVRCARVLESPPAQPNCQCVSATPILSTPSPSQIFVTRYPPLPYAVSPKFIPHLQVGVTSTGSLLVGASPRTCLTPTTQRALLPMRYATSA